MVDYGSLKLSTHSLYLCLVHLLTEFAGVHKLLESTGLEDRELALLLLQTSLLLPNNLFQRLQQISSGLQWIHKNRLSKAKPKLTR